MNRNRLAESSASRNIMTLQKGVYMKCRQVNKKFPFQISKIDLASPNIFLYSVDVLSLALGPIQENLMLDKTIYRWILVIVTIGLLIAPSFLIPLYLRLGAKPITPDIRSQDLESLNSINDAYRKEYAGDLEEALVEYRKAEKSKNMKIRSAGIEGVDRVTKKLLQMQGFYLDLKSIQKISNQIRAPILSILLLLVIITIIRQLTPRRGIAIKLFKILPIGNDATATGFTELLRQEINRITRLFSSEHMERIGVETVTLDLVTYQDPEDILQQALAAVREGDIKSAGSFSLGQMATFLSSLGERPAYVLSGAITLTSSNAMVWARLVDTKDDKTVESWEVPQSEIQFLEGTSSQFAQGMSQTKILRRNFNLHIHTEKDDERESEVLVNLAIVLACKIWFKLSQATSDEMRPSSWQTVFHTTRALSELERFQ